LKHWYRQTCGVLIRTIKTITISIKSSVSAITSTTKSARRIGVLFVLTLLISCATTLSEEGLTLIDQGHVVEGLAKLKEAADKYPADLSLREEYLNKREQIIQRFIGRARSESAAGNFDQATELYQRVLQIDSEDLRAKAGLVKLERDRRDTAELAQAQAAYDKHDYEYARQLLHNILLENPHLSGAKILQRKIDEQLAKLAASGPTLRAEFSKPVTLEFRDANLKMVVEALSRSSGINILLDKDVRPDLKTTIFVKDASVEDTIDLILLQNQLEKKVLSDNTIFIYPNNPAKIKQYQDLMIRSFQLTNADAKEMQTMVKTLLKTRDLYVDEKTNSLVMRDTPDAVRLAEKMIAAQDLADPEVMLEVEVMEVTRSRLTELGVKLPQQIAVSATGEPETTTVNNLPGGGVVTTTTPAQPLTLESLKHLNGSFFNVSPLNASIDLRHEVGNANILASPRIRVRNREKAKILIGDRVPVITNAVTPVSTGSPVVTGTVQYLDVGLKLEVEPDIHPDDDVAIKVNLEVSSIVREVASGPTLAYQIGTRSANTVLRLKDGETQILAGLISDEDRKTAQKFPGLGELPIIGRLFSSHKNDKKKTEIVLSITPHLTRASTRPSAGNIEFWSGTEETLRSRPLALLSSNATAQNVSTSASAQPGVAQPAQAITPVPSGVGENLPIAPTVSAHASSPTHLPAIKAYRDVAVNNGGSTNVLGKPVVLSWHSPTQAKVGDEFQVQIDANISQPLSSLSFTVGYDPKVLKVVRVEEGGLMKQDGKSVFNSKLDTSAGRAFIHMARLGPQGVSGDGSVATITFSALNSAAQSPIVINNSATASSTGREMPRAKTEPLILTLTP